MDNLKIIPSKQVNEDIRFILFKVCLSITSFLGIVFAIINLMNKRPLVNIITGIVIGGLCYYMKLLVKEKNHYTLVRRVFLFGMTFIYLPFGYWTSPGSTSAVLYIYILVIVMLTLIVISKWEYIFPFFGILISNIMLFTEWSLSEHYVPLTEPSSRIPDIAINFTSVNIAIVLIIIYIISQFKLHHDSLYKLSITDPLTKLYNRRYLFSYLEKEYERSKRLEMDLSIVYLDLNNFKKINDKYGHHIGDQILIEVSNIIVDNIRKYDVASRVGGDEFIIVFPETNLERALKNMSRLDRVFNDFSRQYKDQNFSVGYGVSSNENKTLKELLRLADQALYDKKAIQKLRNEYENDLVKQ